MNLRSLLSWRGCLSVIAVLFIFGIISDAIHSCSSENSYDKFEKAMSEGNLSEAKTILRNGSVGSNAALQLIKAYLDAGDADAAIDVYENITSNHVSRYDMQYTSLNHSEYEQKACKLLREYLMQHGQYEKAWNYYPLQYEDENYSGNAQSRYAGMTDVVSEMCKKGRQDDARSFVDDQLRWFVTYIDGETGEDSEKDKAAYGSEVVRQKLYNQIDNVH